MEKVKNYKEFLKLCQEINNQEFIEEEVDVNMPQYQNNLTTTYLLNAIGIPTSITTFKRLKEIGFINLFLHFKNIELEHCLHLLFNPSKSKIEEFEELLVQLQNVPNFVKITKIANNCFIITMKMLDKNKQVYYPFINSDYSKMGLDYANNYFKKDYNTKLKQYLVISRDENFRIKKEKELNLKENFLLEVELEEKLNLNKEIITKELIYGN